MSPDEQIARMDRWRQQVARYRSLSRLFQEGASGPLASQARRLEEQIERFDEQVSQAHLLGLNHQIMLAELDTFLRRARPSVDSPIVAHAHSRFTAEDVREESRLCLEESKAAEEAAMQRLLAARAFELARLAKEMSQPPEE